MPQALNLQKKSSKLYFEKLK